MAKEPFVLKVILDTPISLQGTTLGEYLGRKAVRKTIKGGLGIEEEKKESMMENTNPMLLKLALLNRIAKMAQLEKEAPFKSEAQRRKFHAMAEKGEISKETVEKWESETPKDQPLPERVEKKAKEEPKPTNPISRFATSPAVHGATGAAFGAVGGGALGSLAEIFDRPTTLERLVGKRAPKPGSRAIPLALGGAAVVGGASYLKQLISKTIHRRAVEGEQELARREKKASVEKEAIAPLVAAGLRMLPAIGRGLLGAAKGLGKNVAKPMLFPTTKMQAAKGAIGWAGLSGVQGAAQHKPSQFMGPIRMASLKDRLVELTKQALEAHDHLPASTATAEPDVKKKSLGKSSAVAKSLGVTLGGKSSVTSAPSSPTSIGRKWLSKGKPGGVEHTVGDAPPVRQMSGKSMEEVSPGGEGGGHILRPSI